MEYDSNQTLAYITIGKSASMEAITSVFFLVFRIKMQRPGIIWIFVGFEKWYQIKNVIVENIQDYWTRTRISVFGVKTNYNFWE